ncbi:hypothetical protein K3N28_06040 [Glycomyces sp. TRM65418]|uniref:hypothetical protein n=1 Tax=Glycomyces sp. TRM65418 TaxID=2867006 RepID=UPI001CE58914|nr:hypothetical protein [Glycomyces sp. TRM65418]MCC3762630.1 hypothetical protein [Glycomyces sp. TRM65418]QZD56668.1 hypothetical protein K3N28_06000 [Glycomyces sp. TRM65418]
MPGRTPYDAYQAFSTPLATALATVSRAKIICSQGGKRDLGVVHHLYIGTRGGREYLPLSVNDRINLELRARMKYRIILSERPGAGKYRVTTCWYDYSIQLADGRAVLDFHWHPEGESHETSPHLHIGEAQLSQDAVLTSKQHIPTGRVTFESVVKRLIESGVEPLCDDWADKLDKSESLHKQHRSWS